MRQKMDQLQEQPLPMRRDIRAEARPSQDAERQRGLRIVQTVLPETLDEIITSHPRTPVGDAAQRIKLYRDIIPPNTKGILKKRLGVVTEDMAIDAALTIYEKLKNMEPRKDSMKTVKETINSIWNSGSGLDGEDGSSPCEIMPPDLGEYPGSSNRPQDTHYYGQMPRFVDQGYQKAQQAAEAVAGPSMPRDTGTGASSSWDDGKTGDQIEATEENIYKEIPINSKSSLPKPDCTIRVAHEKQLQIRGEGSEPGYHFKHENGFEIYASPEVIKLDRKLYYHCDNIANEMNTLAPGSITNKRQVALLFRDLANGVSREGVYKWKINVIENNTNQSST